MQLTCAVCGNPFESKRAHAKYCSSTCRSRRSRRGGAATDTTTVQPLSMVEVTQAELIRLARLDTVEGQLAMTLAFRLASAAETGSAIATLSKDLSRVMGLLRAGAVTTLDEVEAARQRRDEKLARARQAPA